MVRKKKEHSKNNEVKMMNRDVVVKIKNKGF